MGAVIHNPQAIRLLSPEQAHVMRVVPFQVNPELLVYVDSEAKKSVLKAQLKLITGLEPSFVEIEKSELDKALITFYRKQYIVEKGRENETLRRYLLEAISSEASDLHFEVQREKAVLRMRIDGNLIQKYQYDIKAHHILTNQIKIESKLNIAEKRLPQDGRLRLDYQGQYREFRVSILPTIYGEKAVLRVLSNDAGGLSIEKFGLQPQELEAIRNALGSKQGLILISGPTGSGKTTTLYAFLKELHKPEVNIITVEDPIEYTLEGITQVQVKEDIGLTFELSLRSILRQDPDIVMIGEIRDLTTALIAVRSALTGHLVLSTIHTNNAKATINRLVDMGIPKYLISDTLTLSIAQRLVRRLCDHCKKETIPPKLQLSELRKVDKWFTATGCPECYYTGYNGRLAIVEMFRPSATGKVTYINGTLKDKSIELMERGDTTIEEVLPFLIENE